MHEILAPLPPPPSGTPPQTTVGFKVETDFHQCKDFETTRKLCDATTRQLLVLSSVLDLPKACRSEPRNDTFKMGGTSAIAVQQESEQLSNTCIGDDLTSQLFLMLFDLQPVEK